MNAKRVAQKVVTILIIISVIVLMLPAFIWPRNGEVNLIIKCRAIMKSLGVAIHLYSEDSSGLIPTKKNWCELLREYEIEYIFRCPKDQVGPCSYAMNQYLTGKLEDAPPDMVLLFESTPGLNQVSGPESVVTERHKKNGEPGCNILFVNVITEFVLAEDILNLRWKLDEGE